MLGNFFTESESVLNFAHLFVYHRHVLLGTFLLVLFSHAEDFAVAFSDVLHKIGSVSNQSALQCVNKGT